MGMSNKERKRFTQTANNYRHARDDKKYKPHKNPMSLPEAEALIRNVLEKWLTAKLNNQNNNP